MGIPQNYLVILRWKSRIMTGVYENDRLAEVFFDDEKNSILGNIYVGKVKNVVKNINAAFVDIGNGQKGYYSLTENTKHFFLNPKKSDALVPGDELLVQVIKEPVKSKPAMLTSNIHLTGQDLVLTANKPAVGISAKITDDSERHHLKTLLESKITAAYGFIARTHAREVKRRGPAFRGRPPGGRISGAFAPGLLHLLLFKAVLCCALLIFSTF